MNTAIDKPNPLQKDLPDTDMQNDNEERYGLIVQNDEVNTFEWVIDSLLEVYGYSVEQAGNVLTLYIPMVIKPLI